MASRTLIRQDRQIRKSDLYNDQLSGGSALESGAASLEDDLNALRSQVNRIINTTVAGNHWYAGLAGRGLDDLDTALSELETQKILFRAQVLTDVAVGAGTNYVVLSVGGSEAPAETAAVSTALNGAVVAYSLFSAGPFGSNELQVVAGPNAVSPKNLVLVRDATTGSGIQSASRDVFGLLQYESSGVDGGSFDDSSGGNRVKISFVRMNSAFNGLEAVPSSDVGGRSVNYFYVRRINLGALPEEAFLITEGAGSGSSGITADEHETLRQLIHLADTGGPWEGFASGAFRETNPSTTAADVTSTAEGTDHQAVDVQIYHGGTAVNPTAIRALTSSDVVTAAQGTAIALSGAWPVKVTDGTNTQPTGDAVGRAIFHKLTDGTNTVAVKAASTAPLATDPSLVVAISPNTPINASNASVSLNNAAIPTSSTQVGGSDGTNLQVVRVFDADSGGGTQYILGSILRKSASGGSVEAGTASDPLRIDPTGTTIQPISSAQLPPALIDDRLDTVNQSIVQLGNSGSGYAVLVAGVDAGTSTQAPRMYDQGGSGSDYAFAVSLRKAAGGGSVEYGTPSNPINIAGTVTANIGTTNGLALDATLTGGSQKAIVRGGAKGATAAADVTSTAEGTDHQGLDVQIYHGGTAINPTAIRALTSSDVVTAAQGTAAAASGGWPIKVTDGTTIAAVKAASTAAGATDPALVVAISPNNTVVTSNASVGSNNAAIPTSSTQVGGSDGTNLQAARVFDADTGGGTQYVLGAILRKGASGGSVEAGTSSDPLRTDPTGTTTQPVSGTVTANIGSSGALALDATLTGGTQKAIVRGGAKGATTAADVTSTAEGTDHQALDIQIYHSGSAVNPTAIRALTSADVVTVVQGTAAALAGFWPVKVTDGTNSMPTADTVGRALFAKTTDGTNTAAVKAASTAAVAADPALVVALSPNNNTLANALLVKSTDGTNTAAVKAASTAAVATDPALVVAISPNNTIPVNLAQWIGSTAPSVGQKTMANSIPVVIASDQSVADTAVSGAFTALNDNVTISVLGKTSVGLRLGPGTLVGTLVVEGTIDTVNYNFGSSLISFDGTVTSSLVLAAAGGTQYYQLKLLPGVSSMRVRCSAYTSGSSSSATLRATDHTAIQEVLLSSWFGSGAPTVGSKTSANSIPVVIASDQAAVAVSDAGGSLTVDTLQLPAALVGGRLDENVGAWLGSTAPTVGSKTAANSIPTVLASDQAPTSVAQAWFSKVTDGTNTAAVKAASTAAVAADPALVVSPSPNSVGPVQLTTPLESAAGIFATNFPAGYLRTTDEPRQLMYDPFDGAVLDSQNWATPVAVGGGVAAATAAGSLTLSAGTTANGYSYLQSNNSFRLPIPGWLGISMAVAIESPVTGNTYRFWGQGIPQAAPTLTAPPILNGAGFELGTDGKLRAVVYSNGTETVVQDLSTSGNSKQPTDANPHRYVIYVRTDRMFWYIDSLDVPVATSSFQSPQIQTLPNLFLAIANSAAPSGAGTITCSGIANWDTGKNATAISDGTYAFRKAVVKAPSTPAVAADSALVVTLSPNGSGPQARNNSVSVSIAADQAVEISDPFAEESFYELREILIETLNAIENVDDQKPSTNSIVTSAAALTTPVDLLGTNTKRRGAGVYNASTAIMYLKCGIGASSTSYTTQVASGGYYEVPFKWRGPVSAAWAAATGTSLTTEFLL